VETDLPALSFNRDALVMAITAFLSYQDSAALEEMRESLRREIDAAGPAALAGLNERFATTGSDWSYYPHDPLARRIHHVLADRLLHAQSTLLGIEGATPWIGAPLVVVANHLSYADANLLEVLLTRAGGVELADRLTVVAGPKVYSSRTRRFSSLCFATIKVPQNTGRSTEDAVMNPREVAIAARQAIGVAQQRLRLGDALLVFPEGTRSRTGDMQPLLGGVTRYLDLPRTWVMPVGITGSEAMFPVGDDRLHTVPIVVRFGRPILSDDLRERTGDNRRDMMDAIGLAIADLLPPAYRGVYSEHAGGLDAARSLLADCRQSA
jgi:1-acyl-sn-glycerol-3-phosphate acyltransferase